jgi:hypothetical protein
MTQCAIFLSHNENLLRAGSFFVVFAASGIMQTVIKVVGVAMTEMVPVVTVVVALPVVIVLPAINGVLRFFLLVRSSW